MNLIHCKTKTNSQVFINLDKITAITKSNNETVIWFDNKEAWLIDEDIDVFMKRLKEKE